MHAEGHDARDREPAGGGQGSSPRRPAHGRRARGRGRLARRTVRDQARLELRAPAELVPEEYIVLPELRLEILGSDGRAALVIMLPAGYFDGQDGRRDVSFFRHAGSPGVEPTL